MLELVYGQGLMVRVFGLGLVYAAVYGPLGQLSLASLRGRLIEYQLRLG